jgi:4-alpha-glucanotransferase
LQKTNSFQELSKWEQAVFERIYNEYHFNRHNEFWREQALWKLPALQQATNIFICAEDLGMIPASVPEVLRELNILTLEIQRAPKEGNDFSAPKNYPYTSVCSPSCHDMSTVRGWWEANNERSDRFYKTFINTDKNAPVTCTPEVVEFINRQHLESPSMWAIFPIQDLVGMDAALRRDDASAEQINVPSNPEHYWQFRFHLNLEELLEADLFNEKVKNMVLEAER